jgi:predicted alpha/beta superfamily hydrolase
LLNEPHSTVILPPVRSLNKLLFKSTAISFLSLLLVTGVSAQRQHTLTGDIRVHPAFHSTILNNDRDIIVFLPPDYQKQNRKRYPVFYMHDGQNLFDGATSFIPGQEWRVDETAQQLIAAGKIEPLIIVGVYNTGKDRINEYTPAEDPKYKMGGKADLYGRFLVEELKPFIDRQYRTKRAAKDTGLGGSSLGGLVSLYLALRQPNVFGRVAAVSPSVWFAEKHITRFAESLRSKPKVRIWLDMGTKEGSDAEDAARGVANARFLRDTLIAKGWKLDKDLKYFEAAGAEHNEKAWAARVELILTFLFPKKM